MSKELDDAIAAERKASGYDREEPWSSAEEMHAAPSHPMDNVCGASSVFSDSTDEERHADDENDDDDEMTIDTNGVIRRNGVVEPIE